VQNRQEKRRRDYWKRIDNYKQGGAEQGKAKKNSKVGEGLGLRALKGEGGERKKKQQKDEQFP